MAQVAPSSRTYFYLKHNWQWDPVRKSFFFLSNEGWGVEADVEVGPEEQQLSIALVVESKETGKKRAPPKKMVSDMGVGG